MWLLNQEQRKQFASFFTSMALFFFATVIAPLFVAFDKSNLLVIVLGVALMIICLSTSMLLLREKYDKY